MRRLRSSFCYITAYANAACTVYIAVTAVQVNETPAVYHLSTPLHTVITNPSSTNNIRSAYPEFKRKLFQASNEEEEGELAVALPAGSVKKIGSGGENMVSQANDALVDGE